MNKIVLIGRICAAPELKSTQNGKRFADITLAVDRPKAADGSKKADFFDCRAWEQKAELICRYLTKGDSVVIIGSMHFENYTDREGNKRRAARVAVREIEFCGTRKEREAEVSSTEAYPAEDELLDIGDADLPF